MANVYKLPIFAMIIGVHFLIAVAPRANEIVKIIGDTGQIDVTVEFVDTERERGKGLMFREELNPMSGMLFDFKREQRISMWMKNTLIPLDMIFANKKGDIVFIKENAQPKDLTIITSPVPALAVLEVNGGFVQKHKVQIGDRLVYTLFSQ